MSMTDKIIDEINKCKTRDEVIEYYQNAMHICGIDWNKLNMAIADKWSLNGLKYIKTKAWG